MLLQGPSFRFLEFAKKDMKRNSLSILSNSTVCTFPAASSWSHSYLCAPRQRWRTHLCSILQASHFMAEESREAAETSEVIAVKRRRQSGIWQLYSKSHCRSIPLPWPTQELGTEGQSCWTVYVMVMSHICPEIERKWLWYWEHWTWVMGELSNFFSKQFKQPISSPIWPTFISKLVKFILCYGSKTPGAPSIPMHHPHPCAIHPAASSVLCVPSAPMHHPPCKTLPVHHPLISLGTNPPQVPGTTWHQIDS